MKWGLDELPLIYHRHCMNWILLTLASAVLLRLDDFVKKLSLKDNAAPIVLLASVCVGASLWTSLIIPPFALGILFFGERNEKAKGMCVLGLLLGVFLISLSS